MALQCAGCLLFLGLSLVLAASDEDLNPPSVEDLHPPSGEEWEGQPLKLPLNSWEDPAEQEKVWEEVWEEHFHLESWQDPPEHDPCFGCLVVKMFVTAALAALAALYTIVLGILGLLWMVGVNTVPFMQGVLALAGVKALSLSLALVSQGVTPAAVYSLF